MEATKTILTLPKPPSVNDIHGLSKSNVYLKKQTLEWYKTAGKMIIEQVGRREQIKGKVALYIRLYTFNLSYDLDNARKLTYDLLKPSTMNHHYGMALIEDDKMIFKDGGEKIIVTDKKDEKLEVEIKRI